MVGAHVCRLRVSEVLKADDADEGDGCTIEVRQLLLNETDGPDCACGTWGQHGTHDGGWAAVAAVAGVLGCHNTAAADSDFCLYCTGEPDQPCDQWGRIIGRAQLERRVPENQHIHPDRMNRVSHRAPVPARCGDVFPGNWCHLCRYTNAHMGQHGGNCFRRCRCPCDGCAVGRVWYTPTNAELDEYESPDSADDGLDYVEAQQEADMDMEVDVDMDMHMAQDQSNCDPAAGEGEAGGPAEDAVAPAGTAQDTAPAAAVGQEYSDEDFYDAPAAAPAASAVDGAAVDTTEAAMDAAPPTLAASATGTEAAAPRGLHQTGLLPPQTTGVVQRLVEEEEELWRTHVEWRRKVHDVMEKLRSVTEEVIRTAPANSRIRKQARVQLKTLQRLMECEEHEEARERMQREEAAQRVMRVAESTGEAEEEWTAALQSRAGTAAGGRLPPQGAAEAAEEAAGREPQTSAGCTPRQQIGRMLQEAEQEAADAEEPEEEPADTGSQDAEDPQEEQDADPAAQVQLEQLQQDMMNAAMLEVVTVGLREMQEQLTQRSEWAVQRERAAQATAGAEHAAARNTTGAAVYPAGTEAAAAGPEDPEVGRCSPETPPHAYSPVTLSYSSDAAVHGAAGAEAATAEPDDLAVAVDTTRAVVTAVSASPAAAEGLGGTSGEDAATARGRTAVRMCEPGHRAGSSGAGSRQATSRMKRKRRMQENKTEKRIHLEKPEELQQTVTTEESRYQQRRCHQQEGVVPARIRDEYVEEAATPRSGDDMAD
jgi:hypothetical protein